MKMAPKPVNEGVRLRETDAPPEAHASSVLILIVWDEKDGLNVLLTQRSHGIDHGGELSFPGGRAEAGETAVNTALRETKEEVGIDSQLVKIAGQLSDLYVRYSQNNVSPVIGFLDEDPAITINPDEVEEAFFVSLDTLLDEKKFIVEEWQLHQEVYEVPYWNIHKVPLWGATAMMMSELLDLYKEFSQS